MKKLIIFAIAILGINIAQAQDTLKVYGDDAFYKLSDGKVEFYYKHSPEDVDDIEYGYGGVLVPATVLKANMRVEGEYVVLKRIKAVQQTGYRFTITFEDLFAKPTNRKGKIKKHLIRWTDMCISAIKQY